MILRLAPFVCLSAALLLASCTTTPRSAGLEKKPSNIDNICSIYEEKPHWVDNTKDSYNKWGIPAELMMAIVRHESSFRSRARPLDKKGKRLSSAYGYSQAIDGTWKIYKKEVNRPRAKRTNFADAIDFIGWYSSKSIKKQSNKEVSRFDVNSLYVFYHDGWSALPEDRSRKLKEQVLEVADRVYNTTLKYHRQLRQCSQVANALYGKPVESWGVNTQRGEPGQTWGADDSGKKGKAWGADAPQGKPWGTDEPPPQAKRSWF